MPKQPYDVRTWDVWLPLAPHAETLIEHTKQHALEASPVAAVANRLGMFLQARAGYLKAEPLLRQALEMDERRFGPDNLFVASDLNNLGGLLRKTNRLEEAERHYRRALAVRVKALGLEDLAVAQSLNNLAGLLRETNRLEEAEQHYRRALAIRETARSRRPHCGRGPQQSWRAAATDAKA
jgi:tetratricopeptide (TPR) repeat protein